jgi:hypothetical protein
MHRALIRISIFVLALAWVLVFPFLSSGKKPPKKQAQTIDPLVGLTRVCF